MPPQPPPLPALQAPVDRRTHVLLRAAVVDLVEREQARRFAPTVHAGAPGRSVRHVDDPALGDAGARADVVLAMLRAVSGRTPDPLLWLTRPGELSPHDVDLRWLAPAAWASRAYGLDVGLVVVTRLGWFDPVSGVCREWRRLRPGPRARTMPGTPAPRP
ncbi:hypothetical protein F4692_003038 [Nocardioides cavernae]|uniref:Uncharacterized protein n=1 Tax=Nocardioides cavernae TaxID=1921566 RepID=A0A7Y9H543_9ACTN|nr:hypothetical protein [Nocardioides cavernae]NYE37893.1 hypothetical protein [Nocardioides cavernae]